MISFGRMMRWAAAAAERVVATAAAGAESRGAEAFRRTRVSAKALAFALMMAVSTPQAAWALSAGCQAINNGHWYNADIGGFTTAGAGGASFTVAGQNVYQTEIALQFDVGEKIAWTSTASDPNGIAFIIDGNFSIVRQNSSSGEFVLSASDVSALNGGYFQVGDSLGNVTSTFTVVCSSTSSAPTFSSSSLTYSTTIPYNTGSATASSIDVATLGAVTGSPTAYYLGTSGTSTTGTSTNAASLSVSTAGVVSYTPATGFRGTDTFQIRAHNTTGDSAAATVTVTVGNPTLAASVATNTGTVGTSYSQQVTISGGKAPYSGFSATGLPTGLTISSSGLISGIPTASGTFAAVVVTATDSSTGTGAFTGAAAAITLTIGTATAPTASNYTYPTTVAYNAGATTFSIAGAVTGTTTGYAVGSATTAGGGAVAIDASGSVTYTPATGYRGSDSFTYKATNAGSDSATRTVTVTVGNPTLAASVATNTGTVGTSYSQQVTISGGKAPYSAFSATGLPTGLTISSSGLISGIPTAAGTFSSVVVTATDSSTGTGPFTGAAAAITLTIGTATAPTASNYTYPTTVAYNAGATTFSIAGAVTGTTTGYAVGSATTTGGGAVAIDASGSVTYTPATGYRGSDSFTYKATNAGSDSATRTVTVTVGNPTLAASVATNTGTVGTSYSQQVTISGGKAPYSAFSATGLPTGLTISSSGLISGIPTASGTFAAVVVTATDSSTGTGAFTGAAAAITLSIGKGAQTVAFTSTAPTGATAGSANYTPTANASSGLTAVITLDAASTGCTLSGGVVHFTGVGTCLIDANQAGNASYFAAVQVQQSIAVGKASPVVSLSPSSTTPSLGTPVTLTATLAGGASPSGTVTFKDGTATLGTGTVSGTTATFGTAALTVGVHTITATYGGDGNNAAATSGAVTVTVGQAIPTIALSSSATSVMQGVPVTFTATVSGGMSPTGSVIFKDGGASLGTVGLAGGTARLSTASLSIGGHTLTATYSGNQTDAAVTSAPLVLTVGERPDPSTDKTVAAMISSQVATSNRFAETQIDNTVRRLEQIHEEAADADDGAPKRAEDKASKTPDTATSVGRSRTDGSTTRRPNADKEASAMVDGSRDKSYVGPDYMRQAMAFDDEQPRERSSQSDAGRAIQKVTQAFALIEKKTTLPFHLWTAGSLDFGKLRLDGTYDNRFSTAGLTIGVDKRIADGLTAGLAFGYGLDHTTFGTDGSKQDATAYTAMIYASGRMAPKTFLDFAGGYGTLHFDEKRWSTDGNVMLSGARDGHAVFGSVGLTRLEKWGLWKVSSYGRVDLVKVMLDRYQEGGSNLWALAYDKVDTTTISAVAGVKADYKIPMEWGALKPGVRLEYRHAFEGGFTQRLGYADIGTMPYAITGTPAMRDALTGGLTLEALTLGDLDLNLEYLLTSDTHTVQSQQVRASVKIPF